VRFETRLHKAGMIQMNCRHRMPIVGDQKGYAKAVQGIAVCRVASIAHADSLDTGSG